MSKSHAELSVSARLLLDYITFRTQHGYPFFENNKTIGLKLDLTEGTIKELINRLVRMGYLFKCKDERKRRQLIITELKHKPLFYPLQDINKRGLKEELRETKDELEKTEALIKGYEDAAELWRNNAIEERQRVIQLEKEIAELKSKLNAQSIASIEDNAIKTIDKPLSNNDDTIRVGTMNSNNSNVIDYSSLKDNPKAMIEAIMNKYKLQ